MALAELASSMPTAGGLYFWASRLGSPAWGWFTAWFNIVGFIAGTAAVGYGAAVSLTALGNLISPGNIGTDTTTIFVFYVAILAFGGIVNMFGISVVTVLNNVSAWWHFIGVGILVLVLFIVPDHHQSVSFVFTKTINASGFSGHGFSNPLFLMVLGLGLLQAQYTIGGYDASAHMSEETRDASRRAAVGCYMAVLLSGVAGWILLLAITFAVTSVTGTIGAGAFSVQYIFQQALGDKWAEFLLFISVVAQILCDAANLTSTSRIIWAFSRDRGTPGHSVLFRLNKHRVPVYALWLVVVIDILLMIPTFWNAAVGYLVSTSITVIALYTAYALVIILRLRAGNSFEHGAWSLGRNYRWIGIISVAWIVMVSILFILPVTPTGVPFHSNFNWAVVNYAPLTLAGAVALFGGWWVLSAKRWFVGPVRQGTEEELRAIDAQFAALGGPKAGA
jgi:amino acid transporter